MNRVLETLPIIKYKVSLATLRLQRSKLACTCECSHEPFVACVSTKKHARLPR